MLNAIFPKSQVILGALCRVFAVYRNDSGKNHTAVGNFNGESSNFN